MGVYVFEEKIKRGKGRVAIQKIGTDDNEEPAITGGYIFKKDHMDRVEMGSSNQGGMPMGGHGGFSGSRRHIGGKGFSADHPRYANP